MTSVVRNDITIPIISYSEYKIGEFKCDFYHKAHEDHQESVYTYSYYVIDLH